MWPSTRAGTGSCDGSRGKTVTSAVRHFIRVPSCDSSGASVVMPRTMTRQRR